MWTSREEWKQVLMRCFSLFQPSEFRHDQSHRWSISGESAPAHVVILLDKVVNAGVQGNAVY